MKLHDNTSLTKNQTLVYNALSAAPGPLSAYTILDHLRDSGFRAPLQVYRALEKLLEFGLVHRLESMNAFVACSQPGCDAHETIAFTICEICETVAEITDHDLEKKLHVLARDSEFDLVKSVVELRGICRNCASIEKPSHMNA